ncbi:MAG: PilZ domain-containing protein [Candidatus Acidiferrales bacterium]
MNSRNTKTGWEAVRLSPRVSNLSELSVSYEGHSGDVPTRPPDIGTHGMFINTSRSFPEGAVLNLQFRLARSGFEIQTRCEVRYRLPGVGVGVEFIGISPDAVRAIEKEIVSRSVRPPRPRKKSSRGKR